MVNQTPDEACLAQTRRDGRRQQVPILSEIVSPLLTSLPLCFLTFSLISTSHESPVTNDPLLAGGALSGVD
jgi:hypothetical protein